MDRPLRDIRISVTDRCNFRRRYCMPEEVFGPDFQFMSKEQLLTFEDITRLATIFSSLGVEKIRLTGGKPLRRKDLQKLIRILNQVEGISDIALSTNGLLLVHFAKELKNAGIKRINVSLDSLDDDIFRKMNGWRCDVKTFLEGIEAAADADIKVKVNMVVQKGHILRFIKYMDGI